MNLFEEMSLLRVNTMRGCNYESNFGRYYLHKEDLCEVVYMKFQFIYTFVCF